jgi:hypothetical protein
VVQFEIKALAIVRSESQTEPLPRFDARGFHGQGIVFHRQAMPGGDVESDIEGFCVMIKQGGRAGAKKA